MFVPESKYAWIKVKKNRQFWKKIDLFLQNTHNGEHIKNSKNDFWKSDFLMGLNS